MKKDTNKILTEANIWDDYKIPNTLTKRTDYKQGNKSVLILGYFLMALIMGLVTALLFYKDILNIYLILVLGLFTAILFSFVTNKSNVTNLKTILMYTIVFAILSIVFSEYFYYYFTKPMLVNNQLVSFKDFFKVRFEQGLALGNITSGSKYILLGVWIYQILIAIFLNYTICVRSFGISLKNGVPEEVKEYVLYLFHNNTSEVEIRTQLSKKGWVLKEDQDAALASAKAFKKFIKLTKKLHS